MITSDRQSTCVGHQLWFADDVEQGEGSLGQSLDAGQDAFPAYEHADVEAQLAEPDRRRRAGDAASCDDDLGGW